MRCHGVSAVAARVPGSGLRDGPLRRAAYAAVRGHVDRDCVLVVCAGHHGVAQFVMVVRVFCQFATPSPFDRYRGEGRSRTCPADRRPFRSSETPSRTACVPGGRHTLGSCGIEPRGRPPPHRNRTGYRPLLTVACAGFSPLRPFRHDCPAEYPPSSFVIPVGFEPTFS